jgi:hypothetical protein
MRDCTIHLGINTDKRTEWCDSQRCSGSARNPRMPCSATVESSTKRPQHKRQRYRHIAKPNHVKRSCDLQNLKKTCLRRVSSSHLDRIKVFNRYWGLESGVCKLVAVSRFRRVLDGVMTVSSCVTDGSALMRILKSATVCNVGHRIMQSDGICNHMTSLRCTEWKFPMYADPL